MNVKTSAFSDYRCAAQCQHGWKVQLKHNAPYLCIKAAGMLLKTTECILMRLLPYQILSSHSAALDSKTYRLQLTDPPVTNAVLTGGTSVS